MFDLAYAQYPVVTASRDGVCVGGNYGLDCNIPFRGPTNAQAFANAWLLLVRPPPRDPVTDQAFQAALQAARASGADRSEEHRRVQVQAEELLAANQREQAAARYREALATSPDWADGHYNLALLAGEMGKHREAIAAMRRYLYLRPDAPDARAARDQIYKWEALLPAAPRGGQR